MLTLEDISDPILREHFWRFGIASYATCASLGRKPWRPYRWLVHLAGELIEPIVKGGARVIVNAPPRHGKSEFVSHWLPTWYLERWPNRQVLLTSYGGEFASEWGRRVRDEFQMNELVLGELRVDSKAVSHWQTVEGGGMVTAGVGGPITGRGGNLVIIDDPHKSWEEALSPISRGRVVDWFNSTLYTRLEPNASVVVIQTRWHEHDLTGYLLDSHQDDWKLIRFPALAEEEDILGRTPGDALCPERYSVERLEEIRKSLGSYVWAGLYQQRPAPLQGGMVQRLWFCFYEQLPDELDEWVQSWDLTFKATGTSYVVGQVWARKGPDVYLVDQVRAKLSFREQVSAILSMSSRWPEAREKDIEDAADAQAVAETLRSEIPGVVLRRVAGSKEARLASVVGTIESGNVHLPARADWLEEFLLEAVTFPHAAHDDQVDAMTLALARLSRYADNVLSIQIPLTGSRSRPWEFANAGVT